MSGPRQMRQRLLDDLASLDRRWCRSCDRPSPSRAPRHARHPRNRARAGSLRAALPRAAATRRHASRARRRSGGAGPRSSPSPAGQGSRLGFDGPKGMFPVTPLRKLTLFALFAEKLLAARRWYGADIPWLIMTGPAEPRGHEEYFESQEWFGLGRDTVHLFMQGSLPSFSPEGRLLMAPDGGPVLQPERARRRHRGAAAVRAARRDARAGGGAPVLFPGGQSPGPRPGPGVPRRSTAAHGRADLRQGGGKGVSRGEAGHHRDRGREADRSSSTRTSTRRGCTRAAPTGGLSYGQGSIAIHILDVPFLESPGLHLPWHLARKKAKTLNPDSRGHRNSGEGRGEDGDVHLRRDPARRPGALLRDRPGRGVRAPEEPRGAGLDRQLPPGTAGAGGPLAERGRRRGAEGRARAGRGTPSKSARSSRWTPGCWRRGGAF